MSFNFNIGLSFIRISQSTFANQNVLGQDSTQQKVNPEELRCPNHRSYCVSKYQSGPEKIKAPLDKVKNEENWENLIELYREAYIAELRIKARERESEGSQDAQQILVTEYLGIAKKWLRVALQAKIIALSSHPKAEEALSYAEHSYNRRGHYLDKIIRFYSVYYKQSPNLFINESKSLAENWRDLAQLQADLSRFNPKLYSRMREKIRSNRNYAVGEYLRYIDYSDQLYRNRVREDGHLNLSLEKMANQNAEEAYLEIAMLYGAMGNYQEAKKYFRMAESIEGDYE